MEVKRYVDFDGEGGGTAEARFGERGQYVGVSDFDRIIAERDALQSRLNSVEGENDRLRTLAKEARGELIAMKAEIGFRGETLRIIGALDIEPEKNS